MDVLNFTCTNRTFDRFLIFEFLWNHCNDFDLRAHECVSDTVRFYFNTDAQSIDGYVNRTEWYYVCIVVEWATTYIVYACKCVHIYLCSNMNNTLMNFLSGTQAAIVHMRRRIYYWFKSAKDRLAVQLWLSMMIRHQYFNTGK